MVFEISRFSLSGGEEEEEQGLDTELGAAEPSHRVQGRGQEEDKRRTRPGHRAGPQSPTTELRGQEEDKAWTQSRVTEPSHRVQGAAKRRTREGHRAGPQSPATEFRSARCQFRGSCTGSAVAEWKVRYES